MKFKQMETPTIIKKWTDFWKQNSDVELGELYSNIIVYRDSFVPHSVNGIDSFKNYITNFFNHFPNYEFSITKYRKYLNEDNYLIHWNLVLPDQVLSHYIANIEGVATIITCNNLIIKEERYFDRLPIAISNIYSLKEISSNE